MSAFTILFGPCLVAFSLIHQSKGTRLLKLLKKVQVMVIDVDCFLTISIMIAATIRLSQDQPIFEVWVLKSLIFSVELPFGTAIWSLIVSFPRLAYEMSLSY